MTKIIKTAPVTRREFIRDVKAEIEHIKSHATAKEIARLYFGTFNSNCAYSCIYGQMTGCCDSRRAKILMRKKYEYLCVSASGPINGDYIKPTKAFASQSMESGSNFTALEKYLYMTGTATHKRIIDYLKGEIKTLDIR